MWILILCQCRCLQSCSKSDTRPRQVPLTSHLATPPPLPATPPHKENKGLFLALYISCLAQIFLARIGSFLWLFSSLVGSFHSQPTASEISWYGARWSLSNDGWQHLSCCLGQKPLLADLFNVDLWSKERKGHSFQMQPYLIFVADAADIVRGEILCHVEKFQVWRHIRCGKF